MKPGLIYLCVSKHVSQILLNSSSTYPVHLQLLRKKKKEKQNVFVKHECPCNGHFFENCDLDIWPWQMTLTFVVKKGFYPKEFLCEIWMLYHLPLKSYGQCKSLCQQTNRQTKNYIPPIYPCRDSIFSCYTFLPLLPKKSDYHFSHFNTLSHNLNM